MAHIDELAVELGDRIDLHPAADSPELHDSSTAGVGGMPLAIVHAESTADVAAALRWANEYRVPVSVWGAGSGLVGGATSYADGLVISLQRMNRILSLEPDNRLITVEPGVITVDVDRAAAEVGLMYAPDPGSVTISSIGGNVATNAGGLRCVAYGVTLESVAGLEVVLPSGEIIETGGRTRKNSTGFNLTGVFVGSEGALGVITKVILRLRPRPIHQLTFLAGFPTLAAAGKAVSEIMRSPVTPEVLELMDASSVAHIESFEPSGFGTDGMAVLVGQVAGAGYLDDLSLIEAASRRAGATRFDSSEGNALLEARRTIGPALDAKGLHASLDFAVPVSEIVPMIELMDAIAARHKRAISTVAHAGDGNLHPSIFIDEGEGFDALDAVLSDIVDAALGLGGTISGEHGIGITRRYLLPRQFDAPTLAAHQALKQAFDPRGILSPGRVI